MAVTAGRLAALFFVFAVIPACSKRGAYEAVRESNRFQCDNRPPSEQKKCLDQLAPPYA